MKEIYKATLYEIKSLLKYQIIFSPYYSINVHKNHL